MSCSQHTNTVVIASALVAAVVALATSHKLWQGAGAQWHVPATARSTAFGTFDDSDTPEGAQNGGVGPATGDMLSSLYFGSMVQQRFMSSDHLLYRASEYPFAMVADLDMESKMHGEFKWKSYLLQGVLYRDGETFSVDFGKPTPLYTHTATKNRSMELSELVSFRHRLLAMCDYTGLIFKITPGFSHVFQRYAIADGNGDEPKPFKGEWATVKDGVLWVGSVGKEWVVDGGRILHRNSEWVKAIHASGRIENYDWGPVYQALRYAANASAPGYLWHEAVHWDAYSRRWVFLPRKATVNTKYDPVTDETQGTNLLLVASENFRDIQVKRLGPLEPEYGFTSVRKLPGSIDKFMALKVKEVQGTTHTKLAVFDLDTNMYFGGDGFIDVSGIKFEGLDFTM